jgi:hypothetical protein
VIRSRVYIALLHYPMYNKRRDIVTTSVTNLDLHDIARAARTYEVAGFYLVHPSASQQNLVEQVLAYWRQGYGADYNPDRRQAFELLNLAYDLESVIASINEATGKTAITVATDALLYPNSIDYRSLKTRIYEEDQTFLLLFGTGWGMAQEQLDKCDYILTPIAGVGDYNHLSVRSAVSIILDRLLGEFWFKQ